MRIEEFEEVADLRLAADSHETVETLGGLIVATLGRFPQVDEEMTVGGRVLRVESLDGLRVATVRLLPTDTQAANTNVGPSRGGRNERFDPCRDQAGRVGVEEGRVKSNRGLSSSCCFESAPLS